MKKLNINKNIFKTLKHRIQHLPLALIGLALGIGGIGNCLATIFEFKIISYITISIVIFILIIMIIKIINHPKILMFDFKDPMFISFLPTSSMCLMLISGFISSFDKGYSFGEILGSILMCLSIIVQFLIIIIFIKKYIMNHKWHNDVVYGSWFVPTVGIITSCTVASNFDILPNEFFQAIWYIGCFLYFISFLPITYSILFKTKVSSERFPSVAVYFAPANLNLAGFIVVFCLNREVDSYYSWQFIISFLSIMVAFGFTMTLLLYIVILRISFNKFNPIFSGTTFPMAISAAAISFLYKFIKNDYQFWGQIFQKESLYTFKIIIGVVALIFTIISTIWISYITGRMFYLSSKILITNQYDNKTHNIYLKSNYKNTLLKN